MKPDGEDQKKVFDVSKPGSAMPHPTSKPIIVGHQPAGTDPMVKQQAEDKAAEDAKDTAGLLVSSSSAKEEKPENSEPDSDAVPKASLYHNVGLEPSAKFVGQMQKHIGPQKTEHEQEDKPIVPTIGLHAGHQPGDHIFPTAPTETSVPEQKNPPEDITTVQPNDLGGEGEVDKAQTAQEADAETLKRQEEIDRLLASETYKVPMLAKSHHGSRNHTLLAIMIFLIALAAMAYVAVSSDLFK